MEPEKNPLVVFTPDNIPAPKQGLSLPAQAAYATAVADINGQTHTPAGTPIIGAITVTEAKKSLESALGIGMANPHAVIMRYGDASTAANVTHLEGEKVVTDTDTDTTEEAPANTDEEPELSITGMLDTIKDTPSIPLAIVGDAGTGKTSIIRKWAEDNGYELNLFLANTASEDDVAGAITPDHENKMAVAYPLEKLHRSTTAKTVLFLDELNTARREVQDPLLTLIQDRCLPNGTPLHPETIIVTAINPSATYNNHEMSPQLRNRFMWYYHNPSEYDWMQWLSTTELGKSAAGKHIESMVLDGTLKFDKDEAFTQERNEFTTPRSLYNLLKVSRGSVVRLKALAENLVAPTTAEAIRLHGYSDKDSRGNSFFDERKKEAPVESKSEKEIMQDFIEKVGLIGSYNVNNGLDQDVIREMMAQYEKGKALSSEVYKQTWEAVKSATTESTNALGGSTTTADQEKSLMDDIKARLSMFENGSN